MIKNEKQYNYSKECARKFEYSISVIQQDEAWKERNQEDWQLDIDAKQSHLMALQEEISEYERLVNCDNNQPIKIKVESFNQLPDTLIKARIAAKMSQKELAEILGIEEQRVQEYEKTDYQCASFAEVIEVSAVLCVDFENAFVKVDFEGIEEGKKIIEKFNSKREERKKAKARVEV
ncbi:hypothetical protein NIES4071_51760 [Calothrix sp. NIES-4071]|nr:hypothetical protein NIES4071_51760 [Calothrix sp. NIES-4071]BAZ59484.1 hypothetical protein NIES4105_51710 [Calothrix sp. NIES-4105]